MEPENREQSEFNMAIFTLGRLNYSLYLCSEHFRNMMLWECFHEMINLYAEISTEMKGDLLNIVTAGKRHGKTKYKTDELQAMEDYIKELEPLVEQYNSSNGRMPNGLNRELYTKLRFMNMLLRQIMKDAGLLMKMKDDASRAL